MALELRRQNATPSQVSMCRSAHHQTRAHSATVSEIHPVPTSRSRMARRRPHHRPHFLRLSHSRLLHLHPVIPLSPYTPSKSRFNGPSPTLVTMPKCPRLGSRRTSDRATATDSLYPHHLRLRPHLTLILNSRRHHLYHHLPSNSNTRHVRRPRCLGRLLCQCRCLLAMALIPTGNMVSKP